MATRIGPTKATLPTRVGATQIATERAERALTADKSLLRRNGGRPTFNRLGSCNTTCPFGNDDAAAAMFRRSEPSFWQFWRHGVTSSFMDCFWDDEEQCRLKYGEGWSKRNDSLALAFGSCVHYILQQAYAFKAEFSKAAPTKADVGSWVLEYERYWRENCPGPTQSQLQTQEMAYGFAEATLPAYFARWGGDFTSLYAYGYGDGVSQPAEWISLEEVFEVPYTYPDGMTVPMRGRRDAVIVDQLGEVCVFDTKTKSRIDEANIAKLLSVDFQAMFYLNATVEQWKAGQLPNIPVEPRNVILNIYRRSQHRQGKKETQTDFFYRLHEIYNDRETWNESFFRIQVRVLPSELKQWRERVLDPAMDSVRGWWEGRYPHNTRTNHLRNEYGMADMAIPIAINDFTDCYKRTSVFPELPEVAA